MENQKKKSVMINCEFSLPHLITACKQLSPRCIIPATVHLRCDVLLVTVVVDYMKYNLKNYCTHNISNSIPVVFYFSVVMRYNNYGAIYDEIMM